jgi:hypothetical protein
MLVTVYASVERGTLRRFHVGRLARIPASDVPALIGAAPETFGGMDVE